MDQRHDDQLKAVLPKETLAHVKRERMKDAMELAQILYDMFKEEQTNAKVRDGQNNAKQTNHT